MILSVACSRVSVGQRSGEHERLAGQRALARRRALLLEPQPERPQVGDQVAHLRVGELLVDQLRHLRPDARRLLDLLRRRGQQRVDRAELLGEVAAGDVADLLDPEPNSTRPNGCCLEASIAATSLPAETSPKPGWLSDLLGGRGGRSRPPS